MKSQIPFSLQTLTNQHINHYILNQGRGLEKQDVLNLFYNDTIGKRELVNELLLATLMPKQWGNGSGEVKEIAGAQEMGAILIDCMGSFSCYKFVERVRASYDLNQLAETVANRGLGSPSKEEVDDKHSFIKQVMSNLYLFQVYSAVDFNLTVRSLAQFLKTHKNIGLVVIDGLHLIENVDIYSIKQSEKYSSSAAQGQLSGKGPKRGGLNNVQAMAMQGDVPSTDDFFGGTGSTLAGTATPQSLKTP